MVKLSIFALVCIISTLYTVTYADRVCHCPLIRPGKPVCGSDNKTYNNRGELNCYNSCENKHVTVKSNGACDCPCPNTFEYIPVCGTDGKTYANKGEVRCHNQCHRNQIQIARQGKC